MAKKQYLMYEWENLNCCSVYMRRQPDITNIYICCPYCLKKKYFEQTESKTSSSFIITKSAPNLSWFFQIFQTILTQKLGGNKHNSPSYIWKNASATSEKT